MAGTPHDQAFLASRWLRVQPGDVWAEFAQCWMAFNALYNAVPRNRNGEAGAIDTAISVFFEDASAKACLDAVDKDSIAALIAIPPGNDLYAANDPRYRETTGRLIKTFSGSQNAVERLSCLMRVVYQVRCNLLHGSKDPEIFRDRTLVSASLPIVRTVTDHLARLMERHHRLPK